MSRENREATTFWMDNDTKTLAKQKAREMDTTMTDLINEAVAYYLQNLSDIDREKYEKIAMKELGREIQDAPRISQIEKDLENLKTRIGEIGSIDQIMSDFKQLESDIKTLKEQIKDQIGEDDIRSIIKTQIAGQLAPTMDALEKLLDQFDKIDQMEKEVNNKSRN